jgi:hypothetical protein
MSGTCTNGNLSGLTTSIPPFLPLQDKTKNEQVINKQKDMRTEPKEKLRLIKNDLKKES